MRIVTHKDMIDATTYAMGFRDGKVYPRMTYAGSHEALKRVEDDKTFWDEFESDYLANWCKQRLNTIYGVPKETPYQLYAKQDALMTQELYNILNKEKENKTMATERDRKLMNTLKKGMLVESTVDPTARGFIEAFDYTSIHVGVRMENQPSYIGLRWYPPAVLRVISGKPNRVFIADELDSGPKNPKPERVIYDEEAGITVVLWEDGQKTIVRAAEGEQMDVYDAFCAAYCKRVYGTNSALKRELNKILTINHPKEPETVEIDMPMSEIGKAAKKLAEDIAKAFNNRNE